MTDLINIPALRQRADELRKNYPKGMVTEHLASLELDAETVLALTDIAEAAHDVDLDACIHGLTWAESEGAANNTDVYPMIDRLREALARTTTNP